MKKVAGSEATRKRIAELMNEGFDASELMRTGMRLMIEQALETEVDEALGRGRYERTDLPTRGYRNGARVGRMKTAEGVVDFTVPQVTGTPEPFVSKVRQNLPDRSGELERVAIEMYARGLSMRDIEAAFTDASGAAHCRKVPPAKLPKNSGRIIRRLQRVMYRVPTSCICSSMAWRNGCISDSGASLFSRRGASPRLARSCCLGCMPPARKTPTAHANACVISRRAA